MSTVSPLDLKTEDFFLSIPPINAAQKSAVKAKGKVLVSAGAGTGKTWVLVLRYAYLAQVLGVSLSSIMVLTFTRFAAQGVKKRLEALMPIKTKDLWIDTFHSLALRLLKHTPEHIKRTKRFSVLSTKDQKQIMAKIFPSQENVHETILQHIHRWKRQTWLPHHVPATENIVYLPQYYQYQQELEITNRVDFDDLLLLSYHMLQENKALLSQWQKEFRHILVDEYQDINPLEHAWLKLFAHQADGLFCVGDEDQSIYGWRGANIKNILRFQEDFPGAHIIPLEENYRSSYAILSGANTLIANNRLRNKKTLRSQKKGGKKIEIRGVWNPEKEADYVTKKILCAHKKGLSYSRMAVLMRTNIQSQEFEKFFLKKKIPYQTMDSVHLYEQQEIKDMLMYLRWIHNPNDDEAFCHVVNTHQRGIGKRTVEKISSAAKNHHHAWEKTARLLCKEPKAPHPLKSLLYQVNQWRKHEGSLTQLILQIFQESGYEDFFLNQGNKNISIQENFKTFLQELQKFKTLKEYLDHVNLFTKLHIQPSQEAVFMLTFHTAKGLEFDETFLVGWEERLFPYVQCLDENNLEEERRLAYVALTRARVCAHITFCWNRPKLKKLALSFPSRFIKELPASATKKSNVKEFFFWIMSRIIHFIRK
ncbi:ATP-dependent helicase [Holospora undulata]|uniref:DNA 3'-5' helicase n=1 Tax=Holospora undulata HU1 TaxID=1321371 RepID=A0A061JI78_9PROT|nr:UvrD-helicase domain-containing protein [Holospora undulata]ETZ04714.1 ATP-dependent DNA helicase PcrA [Holospora undulata HU1]